jgi:hypothetical protein
MITEHWWTHADRRKLKHSEKIPLQYRFVHHKSHVDCPAIERCRLGETPTTNRLSYVSAIQVSSKHEGQC